MYEPINRWKKMEDAMGGRKNLGRAITGKQFPEYFRSGNVAMIDTWFPEHFLGVNFNYGVVPCPNYGNDSSEYVTFLFDDVYMLVRGAKNPEGAWFYMKWYLTSGLLQVAELANYDTDPERYFPHFFTHSYTRERCYDMYLDDTVSAATLDAIKMRDELMDRANCYQSLSVSNEIENASSYDIMLDVMGNKINSIREYLSALQKKGDSITESWLEQKAEEGWVIDPLSDPWGYYAGS